jgi:hypothetical protein
MSSDYATPHDKRRGMLRNANIPGDFGVAPRCGAKTRSGTKCQCPAMPNGRCRLHGGLSTGPKTAAGIERIRRAKTIHGRASKAAREQSKRLWASIRAAKVLLDLIAGRVRYSPWKHNLDYLKAALLRDPAASQMTAAR